MDSRSPKRRRVDASDSMLDDSDISPSINRRASYQAPTAASISRFNPGLLERRTRDVPSNVQRNASASAKRGSRGLNSTALRPKMTAPRLSASPARETSSSPSRRARPSQGSLLRRTLSAGGSRTSVLAKDAPKAFEEDLQEETERSLIEEEKLADSVQRRARKPRPSAAFVPETNQDQSSPELPPTPVDLGLEERAKPPAGIMSSSPRSLRPIRKVILKNSPLKLTVTTAPISEPAAQEVSQQAAQGTVDEVEVDDNDNDDPEVMQRKQRLDQLSKQLQVLRSDVTFLQDQIRRNQERPGQAVTQGSVDRLVNLMTTASTPEQAESSPLKPTSLSSRLSAFLPFAKKPKPLSKDPLLDEEILPSYKPTDGDNPLEHLQAFTPFTISSLQQITIIESEGALLHQQRLILSSPYPAELEMEFMLFSDTDNDAIEQLSVETISPWADAELGSWIRKQVEETSDMATIGWGSSRYLQLAQTRARCWIKALKAFSQFNSQESASPSLESQMRERDRSDEEIAQHLAKSSLRLESKSSRVALLFTWQIDLDWIGDAESRITAHAVLPAKWLNRDRQRNSLSKIPETFERLVQKIGVYEAIKVLVSVVFGTE